MEQRISLVFYEDKYKETLYSFQLPEEQIRFTGLPAETLEEALKEDSKNAVVIVDGERAVGFFILHSGSGISDFYNNGSGAMLLRGFLVDYACQGRGYAKAGMSLLPEFICSNFPLIHEIVLAVNERNISADRLYTQAGFVDHGLRRLGRKGMQKILQYELTRSSAVSLVPHEDELRLRLIDIFANNVTLMSLFQAARSLGPHPYYIGAGCLVQTVWNKLTGRPPEYGISDIDIIYYDEADLSYAAEDVMIAMGRKLFAGTPFPVDIKNQARVHLWYREKFGIDLQPYCSLEAAIDTWPTTATCLGVRLNADDSWHIYAPFGLEDLFGLIVRPNKALINESIYCSKAQKWKKLWPELEIVPWADVDLSLSSHSEHMRTHPQ